MTNFETKKKRHDVGLLGAIRYNKPTICRIKNKLGASVENDTTTKKRLT